MCPVFRMSKGKSKHISGVSEVNLYGMRGEIRINEPMSRHTSWRTGGAARRFYLPADVDDMGIFLRGLPFEEPINMIGLGSNLLVRDGGLPGTTIAVHARLDDLQLVSRDCSGGLIYAGAGVACAKVARFAIKHQLIGAEFLAGIPGTVGGALAMNAGCYGAETWERVEKVQIINRNGEIAVREPDDYLIGYRSVQSRADLDNTSEWFTGGYFRLRPGDASASREKIKQLLTYRVSSQPLNKPNAGSVFRNPPGDHAARLIETCGLKGKRIGGAVVSEKHANFIVNIGGASAADIETLIMLVQETVEQKTGITLIPEVRIIGELGRNTQ